jgi:hypothetical protein
MPTWFLDPIAGIKLPSLGRAAGKEPAPELEFLKSLWGLGTEEEPPDYIDWRNSFLGIDSWAS